LSIVQAAAQADLVQRQVTDQVVHRAELTDRNGVILATSLATASLYADPQRVQDIDETARRLSTILPDLSENWIRERLDTDRRFVWLRRNLTPRQHYEVNRLGLPGLDFVTEESRVYPHGRLVSHAVGFTDIDNRGLAGIERGLEDVITSSQAAISLSLDIRIQGILHEELAAAMTRFRAVGASGLVLDVASGEVIAMVSLPDFDPQLAGNAPAEARFNQTTLGVYEMGSTFKAFTTAMALDSGAVSLADSFDATEPLRISRFTIDDYHGQNRWLTVPEVFIHSSNIGAARMALAVGGERQQAYLTRLGLLSPSAIELRELGQPVKPERWRDVNTITVSYGYGVSVPPLQLASATAAIVNGGRLMAPTLLRRNVASPTQETQVLSAQTSQTMRQLMRLVVTEGTGSMADAPGYLVGGKTGTAEKQSGRGYAERRLLSSFVGVFPVDAPQYVVLALIDEPKGDAQSYGFATGGWVAAPVVGRFVGRAAPLLGIRPRPDDERAYDDMIAITLPLGGRHLASY
ncbi:MAG: penicillin-binding protein 2, partial [Alphaproteobacteria bacterium]